jgi:hypothetical protein
MVLSLRAIDRKEVLRGVLAVVITDCLGLVVYSRTSQPEWG